MLRRLHRWWRRQSQRTVGCSPTGSYQGSWAGVFGVHSDFAYIQRRGSCELLERSRYLTGTCANVSTRDGPVVMRTFAHRHLRPLLGAVVVMAYALPLGLHSLSGVSHTAVHVVHTARALGAEQVRVAAALGLTHGPPSQEGPVRSAVVADAEVGSSALVHTHGGTTHSHAGPVETLIRGTDGVDAEMDEGQAPTSTLGVHTPVASARAPAPGTRTYAPGPASLADAAGSPQFLHTPPPRG